MGEEALPYEPPGLRELVESINYKPGWEAYLALFREAGEVRGWRFHIVSDTEDSLEPGKRIRVNHAFCVPPASFKREVWECWIRDRFADVEAHELGEFLQFAGERVFAPHHGNGEDPYIVWHHGTEEARAKRAGED